MDSDPKFVVIDPNRGVVTATAAELEAINKALPNGYIYLPAVAPPPPTFASAGAPVPEKRERRQSTTLQTEAASTKKTKRSSPDGNGASAKKAKTSSVSVAPLSIPAGGYGEEPPTPSKRTPKANPIYAGYETVIAPKMPKVKLPKQKKAKKEKEKKLKQPKPKTPKAHRPPAGWERPMPLQRQPSMPKPMSKMERQLEDCKDILKMLMADPNAWPFLTPVDPDYLGIPDYFTIIKCPMDFGTIKKRLSSKAYSNTQQFAADVRLTLQNALTYNEPGSDICKMATILKDVFEERFAQQEFMFQDATQMSRNYLELQRNVEQMKAELMRLQQQQAGSVAPPIQQPTTNEADSDEEDAGGRGGGSGNNARPLSFEEKMRLSEDINKLPNDKLGRVVQITRANANQPESEEVELDIDALDPATLRKLQRYVRSALNTKKRRPAAPRGKPKTADSVQDDASRKIAEIEQQIQSLSNNVNQAAATAGKKKGNEDEELEVDDGMPTTKYPTVHIEKDKGSESSSGSSSSSSSGSSSSSSSSGSSDAAAKKQPAAAKSKRGSQPPKASPVTRTLNNPQASPSPTTSKASEVPLVPPPLESIIETGSTARPSPPQPQPQPARPVDAPKIIDSSKPAGKKEVKLQNADSWAGLAEVKPTELSKGPTPLPSPDHQTSTDALWSEFKSKEQMVKQREKERLEKEERLRKERERMEAEKRAAEDRRKKEEEEARKKKEEEKEAAEKERMREIEDARNRAKLEREKSKAEIDFDAQADMMRKFERGQFEAAGGNDSSSDDDMGDVDFGASGSMMGLLSKKEKAEGDDKGDGNREDGEI